MSSEEDSLATSITPEALISHYGRERALKQAADLAGYVDVPPTITEFLEDKFFCGDFLGKGKLYPTWKEYLEFIFQDPFSCQFREIAVTGSIGSGKTTFCAAGVSYDLCKLLYLKDPHDTFGLLKSKAIILACINTTKTLAEAGLYNTLMEWMNISPFFLMQQAQVPYRDKRKKRDLLPHKINIMNASQGRQALGLDVFAAVLSELNFQGAHIKDQAVQNYTQISHRMESRFQRGGGLITPGRLWLDSSKSDETGWLEQHMKSIQDDADCLLICKAIWDIKERAGTREYCGDKFLVFIGDQTRDPMILEGPQSSIGIPSDLIIKVPVEYRRHFERSLIGSIQNLGGYSTWGSHKFISHERLVRACVEDSGIPRENPCTRKVVSLDFDDDQDQLINYIDLSKIPREIPFYIHYDIGVKRDRTGIALTRCMGEIAVERASDDLLINHMTRDFFYETTLVLAVQAKPGKEVPLSKLRNLIVHLQNAGVPVVAVSADGYQSTELLQQAKKLGLLSDLVSMDRTRDAYDYLKDCILERRWKGPDHEILTDELLELRDEGKKIDHPVIGSSSTNDNPSKDLADAVAGSVYNCKQRAITQKTNAAYEFYADQLAAAKKNASHADYMRKMGFNQKRGRR